MIHRKARNLLLLLLVAVLALYAQVTGRLSGTVLDPSGASIPAAKVTVINQGTGAEHTAETNAAGAFLIPALDAGTYLMRVTVPGFRVAEVKDVKVDVGKEHSMAPISMEVGAVQETVSVSAGANLVQTTSSEIASTIYTEQIKMLPLAGRNPLALLSMQAGAGSNGRTATVINGMRISTANVSIDGINVQDNFIRTNSLDFLPNLPFLSQVGEITLGLQNNDASAGNGSSQVSLVTPSGSNAYHAEGFWLNRTSATAANSFFNNASGVRKPFRLTNQFGGNVGGPILRDKLLFFAYYDASRQKLQSARNTTILLPDARNGIFTYLDSSGNRRQLNVLQAAGVSMDPAVRALLDKVPTTANFTGVGDQRNTSGYRFNQRNNRTRDNVGVRVDFNPGTRHNISGTYSYNRDILDRPDQEATYNVVPLVTNDDTSKLLSATWRWAPTPAMTNELRGGFNLAPVIFSTSEKFGPALFTGFSFTNPANNFRLQGRDTDTYNLMDNLAWQRGTHALRFGWQSQFIRVRPFNEAGITPTYTIGISAANLRGLQDSQFPGGISASERATANSLLASLAGFVTTASQTFNVTSTTSGYVPGAANIRNNSLNGLAFYGTDQWRIRRNLTLNYGLRWEYMGRYDERDGLLLLPVIQNGNVVQTLMSNATVDFHGSKVGRPAYDKDLNNFGPNLGLAWDPWGDGKTAVRLGYSINYVNDDSIRAPDNAVVGNAGLSSGGGIFNLTQTVSGGLPTIAAPAFKVPRTFTDQLLVSRSSAGFAVHPKLQAPYIQQWNLSVQRELPWRLGFEARYVGNKGTHLYRGIDYNQVIIGSNGFLADFQRARNNGFLALAATGQFNPAYNSNIAGSQQLTVFPNLAGGGSLTSSTNRGYIQRGEVGELVWQYFILNQAGSVSLLPNPNIGVADVLDNGSNSVYHSLQVEVKRRVKNLLLNANYTWSKVLTDSSGTGQTRFDPQLDNANPRLERSRADFDQPHAFKANFIYELPFGSGHRLASSSGVLNKFISGWHISSIFTWQTGPPFSILSDRGTLNRSGRSGDRNTATTLVTADKVKDQLGVLKTGNAVYFINPSLIGTDGRGVAPDGAAPLSGQIFFHPGPGQVGALERRMFNGPTYFNWDFAVLKQTNITESKKIEFRVEFFSLPNNVVFYTGDQNINSTNFGKMTSLNNGPRFLQTSLRLIF